MTESRMILHVLFLAMAWTGVQLLFFGEAWAIFAGGFIVFSAGQLSMWLVVTSSNSKEGRK